MNLLFSLIGCQPYGDTTYHGGGNYSEMVFRRIIERGLPVKCIYDFNKWLNPEIKELIKAHSIEAYDISKLSIQEIIDNSGCDVFYTSRNTADCCLVKNIDVVATKHDMREFEVPEDGFFWRYRNNSWLHAIKYIIRKFYPQIGYKRNGDFSRYLRMNKRLRIVTVSQHSSVMIKYFYPEFKSFDVPVFYSPSTSLYNVSSTKYLEKYFLLISANRWTKNNLRAIMALDNLFSKHLLEGYKVRITGIKDDAIFRYKIKNRDKFVFMGYVDDNELVQLYHDCYCLIFPSLNEGFGYPPIEAMRFGVPVLASAISSIPEICGDAALYFFPLSVHEIAGSILKISQECLHSEYSKRSLNRYSIIHKRQMDDLEKMVNYLYKIH